MYLLVYSKGTDGWLILAEDVPLRPKRGIVRVIAALAGSNVCIKKGHLFYIIHNDTSMHFASY